MGLKQSKTFDEVADIEYDLLYIPGGKAPEALKKSEEVLAIVRDFSASGKTIAALCHGPQVLAAAGVITGKTISAWPDVQKEIEEAGANYASQECCVDGQFITARWPSDLPAFMAQVIKSLNSSLVMKASVAA